MKSFFAGVSFLFMGWAAFTVFDQFIMGMAALDGSQLFVLLQLHSQLLTAVFFAIWAQEAAKHE